MQELAQRFDRIKRGRTAEQTHLISRIEARAMQSLEDALREAEMGFALAEEANIDDLEWHYERGYELGLTGKDPGSINSFHIMGYLDAKELK